MLKLEHKNKQQLYFWKYWSWADVRFQKFLKISTKILLWKHLSEIEILPQENSEKYRMRNQRLVRSYLPNSLIYIGTPEDIWLSILALMYGEILWTKR